MRQADLDPFLGPQEAAFPPPYFPHPHLQKEAAPWWDQEPPAGTTHTTSSATALPGSLWLQTAPTPHPRALFPGRCPGSTEKELGACSRGAIKIFLSAFVPSCLGDLVRSTAWGKEVDSTKDKGLCFKLHMILSDNM